MRDLFLFLQGLFNQWLFYAGAALTMTPFVDRYLQNPWSKLEKCRGFLKYHIRDLRWIGIFCILFACYRAWDIEHKNVDLAINGQNGSIAAWNKYNQCDAERTSLKTLVNAYSSELENQQSFVNNQQATINTCVLTLAKNALHEPIRVVVWTAGIGIIQRPVVTEIVLVTNRQTTLRGNLECDQPFGIFDWTLASGGVRMGVRTTRISEKEYHLETSSPLWEPQIPVLVNVTSDSTLRGCKFTPRQ